MTTLADTRIRRGGRSLLIVGALLLVCTGTSAAVGSPTMQYRMVAETGMPAPGTEPDVVFGALTTELNHNLLVPRIDEAGRVAFMAMLAGPDIDVTNFQGIWAERDGEVMLVARGGDPAPGTEPGTLFLGVPSLELPFAPEFGGGQAAFHAELTGIELDFTTDQGFWVGEPGDVHLVAREGAAVPDLPDLTFGIPFGLVNEAGHVVVQNDLRGPGVGSTNNTAIFTDRSGTLELFLREGEPAPLMGAGIIIGGTPTPFNALAFNANSRFAISARLSGPTIDTFNDELLYVEREAGLALVLREGDPAPGAGEGVIFGVGSSGLSLNSVDLNENERVAFLVRLGGAVSTRTAIYSDYTGELAPVALPGEPAPGEDFDFTLFATPRLNDADEIAFAAAYPHDGGIFTPPPYGIFSDVDGTIEPVAGPGDTTAEGEIIEHTFLRDFNAAGLMLLDVRIDSPTFRSGFWLRDAEGVIHRVAATGDQFDMDGNGADVRQVIRVVTGGLNEAGQVAIRLDFADSSSAHFVASLCTGGMTGDSDDDCDIDLVDYQQFEVCLGGPGGTLEPGGPCESHDFDQDADVDLADYQHLQLVFSGPGA